MAKAGPAHAPRVARQHHPQGQRPSTGSLRGLDRLALAKGEDLRRRLRGSSRWFPFGTGNSVNRFLLDTMARLGGGEVEYILLTDPGDKVARSFYDRIASPVLTDVRLEFSDLDVVADHTLVVAGSPMLCGGGPPPPHTFFVDSSHPLRICSHVFRKANRAEDFPGPVADGRRGEP